MYRYWRFIDTKVNDASWNMAVDEALLNNYRKQNLPIFRIYGWKRGLSIGRFTKIQNNLDLDKLNDLPYVRRMTGGGILVHGGDISYSLIFPKTFLDERSVKESYRYICSFLFSFYGVLGLDVSYLSQTDLKTKKDDICLAGHEPYDIVCGGSKLGGNAQRYSKGLVFQHGSIPLEIDKEFFEPLFFKRSGLDEAATLLENGINIDRKELIAILKKSFCKSFECELIEDKISTTELNSANELLTDKYTLDSWNIDGKYDN